ncbi:RITA1 protein, partial [Dicaeum eximium]|nr:RITA1 protein [Dicaeum eximium]
AAPAAGLDPRRCPRGALRSPSSPPARARLPRRLSVAPPVIPPAVTNTCFSACRPPRPRRHAPSFCDESLFGAKLQGPAWAAPRMRKEDVAKLHSLLWSPPPAPRDQPGLSSHRRGTPLRAVHPPASAPPAASEPGHEEKLRGWRHPGSDARSKGRGAAGGGRSQSVSRLSTPPDRIHLSPNLGTERWKNRSTPTTPAAPQGPLVRGRSSSVSGSPVLRNAKAAGGCTARPPWK